MRRHVWLALALAAAVGTFASVVRLPFVFLDDPAYVSANPLVAAPLSSGLEGLLRTPVMGYPAPVTILSLALDRKIFGLDPAGYHAVNLGLHLGVVALLYVLGLRLGVAAAWAGRAAALFAVHPIVTEPVAWATGRKDLLAAVFLLASIVVLLGGRGAPAAEAGAPPRRRWAVALTFAFLALLSKPSALAAPLLLFLVARHGRPAWSVRDLGRALLYPSVVVAVIAVIGARGHIAVQKLPARDAGALVGDVVGAATLQLGHLLWPKGLLCAYYRSDADPSPAAMTVATLALVAAVLAVRRLSRPGSAARVAMLLAVLTYLPVSSIVANLRWTADSYLYLPLAGISLGLMALAERRWPRQLVGFPALVALLAVISFHQTDTWKSNLALWKPVVARYPDQPWTWNRLGFAQLADRDEAGAIQTFLTMDGRFPDFPSNRAGRAWAHATRGDRARAEELQNAGVRAGEEESAARLWVDLLQGQRDARGVPADVAAHLWRLGGKTVIRARDPVIRRRAADLLRQWGQFADAAEAESTPL